MNPYNFAPIRTLLETAHWAISHLTDLLIPIAGAGAAALAIILLTVAVRTLLIPVGVSQAKAQVARARLAPRIADLNRRYRDQPQVLRERMMQVYAEEGANPAAGCLPMLAQMPVLMAVYGLFIQPVINESPNRLLDYSLAGVPLNTGLLAEIASGNLTPGMGAVFAILIALIGVVAHLTRRLLPLPAPQTGTDGPAGTDLPGMSRVLGYMPFVTAIIAAVVPLAAGLYLATTSAWTLGERLVLARRYPPGGAG